VRVRGLAWANFEAELRRIKSGHWWSKEELESFKCSKGNQVRGAVLRFPCSFNNYMNNMITWMHISPFICVILISGNFPESAWQAIHSCQAAHTKLCVFWVTWWTTWRWSPVLPGDAMLLLCFWVLWGTAWQWWISARRRESVDSIFMILCIMGKFQSGGIRGLVVTRWLR